MPAEKAGDADPADQAGNERLAAEESNEQLEIAESAPRQPVAPHAVTPGAGVGQPEAEEDDAALLARVGSELVGNLDNERQANNSSGQAGARDEIYRDYQVLQDRLHAHLGQTNRQFHSHDQAALLEAHCHYGCGEVGLTLSEAGAEKVGITEALAMHCRVSAGIWQVFATSRSKTRLVKPGGLAGPFLASRGAHIVAENFMNTINTNIASLQAQRALLVTGRGMNLAMQQASTGKRINSAADDAAGLAISNKMTAQTRGLLTAIRNVNDGISLAQVGGGAMMEMTNMLQRMRELSVQASTDTLTPLDRSYLDSEYQALKSQIESTVHNTHWNGMPIFSKLVGHTSVPASAPAQASTAGPITIPQGRLVYSNNFDTGFGADTTIEGNASIVPEVGAIGGYAVYFDGNGAGAVISSDSLNLGLNDFRIAFRVKSDGSQDIYSTILSRSNGYFANIFNFHNGSATGQILDLTPNAVALDSSIDINDGDWHDIVLARIGTTLIAQIDGTQSQITIPTVNELNLSPLRLGRWQGNNLTDNNFKGFLDNLSVSIIDAAPNPAPEPPAPPVPQPSSTEFLIQAGANRNQSIKIKFDELPIPTGSVDIKEHAIEAIDVIDASLEIINQAQASLGAVVNRLESAAVNLGTVRAASLTSQSQIQDNDYARTSSNLAKLQIVQQAATAVLAQANQSPSAVMKLLEG